MPTAGAIFAKLLKAKPKNRAKLKAAFEKQSSKQLGGAKVRLISK